MTSVKKSVFSIFAITVFTGVSSIAYAEPFSLHMEGGLAGVAGSQAGNFRPGMVGSAKLLFPVFTPNVAVGPSVSAMSFEEQKDHTQAANLWQFGATARLQGNHDAVSNMYPWVDVSGSVDKTGSLYRPGLSTAVGLNAFTDKSHTFSFGPWLGYSHTFDNTYQQTTALLPHRDANILQAGLSFSFDGAPKRVAIVIPVPVPVVVASPPIVRERIVNVPAPAPSSTVRLVGISDRVAFDHDSAALNDDAKAMLDKVAKVLALYPDNALVVQGVASSDGDETYNLKLSMLRAVSVVDYLANHGGVERSRLTPVALGAQGEPKDEHSRNANFVVFECANCSTLQQSN